MQLGTILMAFWFAVSLEFGLARELCCEDDICYGHTFETPSERLVPPVN